MKTNTVDSSLFFAALQMYQRWSSQVFVYATTLILSTSTALFLDLWAHWPSERVLLYTLPLSVLLLVLVPTLTVIFKKAKSKRDHNLKPRSYTSSLIGWIATVNPLRALAQQFIYRSPMTLLAVGVAISMVDFGILYAAAVREGVLRISPGMGLLNNYGLFSTTVGNAVLLYTAKKYYESVCSIRTSKAIVNIEPIDRSIALLTDMIKLRGRYNLYLYFLMTVGALFWVSNVAIYVAGFPEIRWGYKVFDSIEHPLTFFVSRIHNFYTWLIIMPFVVYVVTCSSLQLRRAIVIAFREGALTYDLLNPDQRGGFGFLRKAQIAFNVITGLIYIQLFLYSLDKLLQGLPGNVTSYITLTSLLIWINVIFFSDIYKQIKTVRFESLDRLKDKVYQDDKLSFDILKYCYERRVNWYLIISIVIQAAAIIIAGIAKLPR
jgi:hypothetical protein